MPRGIRLPVGDEGVRGRNERIGDDDRHHPSPGRPSHRGRNDERTGKNGNLSTELMRSQPDFLISERP
jgi:hypothetical protein